MAISQPASSYLQAASKLCEVLLDNFKWAECGFAHGCAHIPQSGLVFRVQKLPFICIQIRPDHYQLKQHKKDLMPETPVRRLVSPVHSGF